MTTTLGAANNSILTGPPPAGVYLVQLKLIEPQDEPTQYSPNGQFRWVMAIKSCRSVTTRPKPTSVRNCGRTRTC